jgi:hypothetical protein
MMKGFDEYDGHTTQAFKRLGRDVAAKIDRLTELMLMAISSMKK